MVKKNMYVQPATTVVSVATETLIAQTVQNVQSNATGINYGGGSSNQAARVKERGDYNVWNDDWSE